MFIKAQHHNSHLGSSHPSGMDTDLFKSMLALDSTSGQERTLAEQLAGQLGERSTCSVQAFEVGDGTLNLLLTWGSTPQVIFCTHLDTVPPFIAPRFEPLPNGDLKVNGRGSCDAKGQIFAMFSACQALEREGLTGFGLLLLAGEETGSHGAKAYARHGRGAKYVVVGEPTDNKMVKASKGTKAFNITIEGKRCHSGYPEQGDSAIERFVDFVNQLRAIPFPTDEVTGATTYNIGQLQSDNPQNVLSDNVQFKLYFRTTQASDAQVVQAMEKLQSERIHIEALGGDTPMSYLTLDGFETTTAAFGSDAPRLDNFECRMLCGPGSILVAHQDCEHVLMSELEQARDQYVAIFKRLTLQDKKHQTGKNRTQ